jgi:hypothetical protein
LPKTPHRRVFLFSKGKDVGINPSQLFLIGNSLTYTATQGGTLYLGINDWITDDNGGSFSVTLNASTGSQTPEPETITLVGLGALAIVRKLRQRVKRLA